MEHLELFLIKTNWRVLNNNYQKHKFIVKHIKGQ